MVGEGAIQFKIQGFDCKREASENLGHGEAGHAVGSINRHFQRPNVIERHEFPQEGRIVSQGIRFGEFTGVPVIGGDFFHQVGDDVSEAGFLPNGSGARPTHFDAVIFRGVMGGGEHGAGNVPIPGDEIELVSAGEPEE